jgi:hypothetical protein
MLEDPASSDIRERVANNNLAMEEAITLLRKRNEEEIRRIEAEAAARNIGRNQFKNIANFLVYFRSDKIETLVALITPKEGEEPISDMNHRPFTKEEMIEAAQLLTNTANAINN